jgi:hypothetical protein
MVRSTHTLTALPSSMLTCSSLSDYINPIDLCNRLNTYIVPEAAVHAFITILFLVNGYWIALILNLPLLAWNAKKSVPYTLCTKRVC